VSPFVSATAQRHQGTRIERVCVACSRPFVTLTHQVDRGRGKCCSRRCSAAHAARVRGGLSGERNPAWKGGISADHMRYKRRFAEKSPEKVRAHRLVARAVRRGELVRPAACSSCGMGGRIHGHHDDYGLPLVVRWLCHGCNNRDAAAKRLQKAR
jgi:hypothetical protein